MSRKPRKRKKRKERTPNLPPQVMTGAGTESKRPSVTLRPTGDFDPDYSYVVNDLRRIGVLAASFIVVLIILAIVLN